MNNQWSDNLRKRMEEHIEPSPNGLWDSIETSLKKEQFSKKRKSKETNKFPLWATLIASVAAIVFIIYLINIQSLTNKDNYTGLFLPTLKLHEKLIFTNNINLNTNNLKISQTINQDANVLNKEKKDVFINNELLEKDSIENKEQKNDLIQEQKKIGHEGVQNTNLYNEQLNTTFRSLKSNNISKWSSSIYALNISNTSSKKIDGYSDFSGIPPLLAGDDENPTQENGLLGNILENNVSKEVYSKKKHKQPITLGVSVTYNLDEKWSVTSGFNYNKLVSDLYSGSTSDYYQSKQTLDYIGIPISIDYNIFKTKTISIYLSGGGQIQKNISGKLKTDYIVSSKLESTTKEKISINNLQYSLNGSVGIQYNILPTVGIYVKPGINYYFKNSSNIETIYREKPFNVDLQLGLRFSFNK